MCVAPDEAAITDAIARAVAANAGPVRVAGTGHSFTPIVTTDGTLITIDGHAGVVAIDAATGQARVRAGTKICDLGAPLLQAGLALANQGDINRQSISGAVATGTHGTGAGLGSVSAQVCGVRLATASGATIDATQDRNPDIYAAARVSLGMLGAVTELTLQCVPAYRLQETGGRMATADVFAQMADLVSSNRHFEFFWFPFADEVLVKFLNLTQQPARPQRPAHGRGLEHYAMVTACELSRVAPILRGPLQRFLTRNAGARYMGQDMGQDAPGQKAKIREAYQAFPSDRDVRFNEMEYAVAAEDGPDCVQELAAHMRKHGGNFIFPIEYRTVKADDIWLSPFQGRDSVTISIHQYAKQSYRKLFDGAEAIFRRYGGRPHWGKLHSLTARELAPLYPHWDDFQAMRRQLDPKGLFLTPYLARLVGEPDGG